MRAEAQIGEPRASAPRDPNEEASSESDLEACPPARSGLGSGCSTRPSLRIRFANAHGMAQVAQAFPIAWEPEPMPRARECDNVPPQV